MLRMNKIQMTGTLVMHGLTEAEYLAGMSADDVYKSEWKGI